MRADSKVGTQTAEGATATLHEPATAFGVPTERFRRIEAATAMQKMQGLLGGGVSTADWKRYTFIG
jgi:DNA-directed RNA polymerase sigma subunit (sigma70/sigma32)